MRKLVGIVGYMGAGKTTVCNEAHRQSLRGICRPITRIGFADPLYSMLIAMGLPSGDVMDKAQWNKPQPLLSGKTLRDACRTLGTEWGRAQFGRDVWARIAIERARCMPETVIIDNVRFHEEADAIEAEGGTLIAWHRPDMITPDTAHESERHIREIQSRCRFRFVNDFDIPTAGTELCMTLAERGLA